MLKQLAAIFCFERTAVVYRLYHISIYVHFKFNFGVTHIMEKLHIKIRQLALFTRDDDILFINMGVTPIIITTCAQK